jgi:hypothetical protein
MQPIMLNPDTIDKNRQYGDVIRPDHLRGLWLRDLHKSLLWRCDLEEDIVTSDI